jgi:hypothetical protein
MDIPHELKILILQLIAKHPTINNDYSLIRYLGKSSVLPDKLRMAKQEMVDQGLISVVQEQSTVKHFEATNKGLELLDSYNLIDYLSEYALEIDKSEFILKIIRQLEEINNKE